MLLYAVRGPSSHMSLSSRKQTVVRDLHDAVSFSRLSSFCKMIVPVGLPSLSRSKSSYDFGCLLSFLYLLHMVVHCLKLDVL